jgi:hypothetical protein
MFSTHSYGRDKIADEADWKDGMNAFREKTIRKISDLEEKVKELEEKLNET